MSQFAQALLMTSAIGMAAACSSASDQTDRPATSGSRRGGEAGAGASGELHGGDVGSTGKTTGTTGTTGMNGTSGTIGAAGRGTPDGSTDGGRSGASGSAADAGPDGAAGRSGDSGSVGDAGGTCAATYQNPVVWEDLPDLEVIRVNDTYYYTASSFHYSPGAPLLRSYDLVHWEYVSHSVPVLDYGPNFDLTGGQAYVNGIWASSLRYRQSNKTYYWMGCMHGGGGGYVYTATAPEGPWTKHASRGCYYDVGLLIDDDDTMYVAYGNNTLHVAQLGPDGFSQVKSQVVFNSPANIGPLEGSRFYKINGNYYIFTTQYANGEYVLRSTTGPFGPYTLQKFAVKLPFGGSGAGGSPHQGGIVETQHGDWYYMAFNDSYPAGRLPVLAPVKWADGWPSVELVNGAWGGSYPFPNLPCGADKVKPLYGTDSFTESTLQPHWEWNHNPDNTKWSSGRGLTLQTATVTSDPYAARNTLTRRMVGPRSTATIRLDYRAMKDGDVAGLAAWRDSSAFIALKKAAGSTKVTVVNNLTLNSEWNTSAKGTEVASADVSGGSIWLRVLADVRTDAGGGTARFYYSTDGEKFTSLGTPFTMKRDWPFFTGYRYAILNYATQALGGSVTVGAFELTTP